MSFKPSRAKRARKAEDAGVVLAVRVHPSVASLVFGAVERGHYPTRSALIEDALLRLLSEEGDRLEVPVEVVRAVQLQRDLVEPVPMAPGQMAAQLREQYRLWLAVDLGSAELWAQERVHRLKKAGSFGQRVLALQPFSEKA